MVEQEKKATVNTPPVTALMVEQEKKATVNTPPVTALTPQEPAPVALPVPKSAGWLTRETKLAVVVLASFLALAAGVYAVKVLFKSETPAVSTEVVQAPIEPIPEMPTQLTRTSPLEPSPVPESKRSPAVIAIRPDVAPAPVMETPPVVLVEPANSDPLIILPMNGAVQNPEIVRPMDPVIALPKQSAVQDPVIVNLDPPPARKDAFSSTKKDGTAKKELPSLDLPPVIDALPEVKNPVIRIGASEPKKEAPLKVDLPPIPDPPAIDPPLIIDPSPKKETPKKDLLALDPPLVIDPVPMKKESPAIDPPLVIDPVPMKKETPKKDPLALDPPLVIDPVPMKKEAPAIDPPLVVDPPMKKVPALDVPIVVDPPPPAKNVPMTDPSLVIDPPMTKTAPVIEIDLKDPPQIAPKKVEAPATSNDYDEDLHPFRKEDSYRSISKQYYNSDAYAIALQRYNKDHPGQADYVRVPPIWLLEKKYANDLSSTSARSTSNAPPPSIDLASRNEQVYVVGDNGEMLADIARQRLGSEDAWKRIWDLNPQLNPAKMIPGGTRLRLP